MVSVPAERSGVLCRNPVVELVSRAGGAMAPWLYRSSDTGTALRHGLLIPTRVAPSKPLEDRRISKVDSPFRVVFHGALLGALFFFAFPCCPRSEHGTRRCLRLRSRLRLTA